MARRTGGEGLDLPFVVVVLLGAVLLLGCGSSRDAGSTQVLGTVTSTAGPGPVAPSSSSAASVPTTTVPTTTSIDAPPGTPTTTPVTALTVDPPIGFEDLSDDHDSAVLFAVHGDVRPELAVYFARGRAAEPAGVLDPDVSILGNQALAAALAVVDDLLGGAIDDPEVLASEATTVEGRPAWRLRFRVLVDDDRSAEVDLVGFEDSGEFDFVVGVVSGDGAVSGASIGSIIDRARLTPG